MSLQIVFFTPAKALNCIRNEISTMAALPSHSQVTIFYGIIIVWKLSSMCSTPWQESWSSSEKCCSIYWRQYREPLLTDILSYVQGEGVHGQEKQTNCLRPSNNNYKWLSFSVFY